MARRGLGLLAACVIVAAGCGKKGPPLAPLIRVPAAVDQISARRIGHDVYVTLTVPAANIDTFKPADINEIQIFGYTGRTAPPRTRWAELGTLVATVPVAPPPPPPVAPGERQAEAKRPARRVPRNAPQQGTAITILDALTADELVQGRLPPIAAGRPDERRPAAPAHARGAGAAPRPEAELPLRRFYTAFPFNPRGTPGPPGAVAELPLAPVEAPTPPAVDVGYTEAQVVIVWEPAGGLLGFLLERTLPEEVLPFELEEAIARMALPPQPPRGALAYNVYRVRDADPFAPPPDAPATPWLQVPPAPINPAPVAAQRFTDAVSFNRQQCYVVRGVRLVGVEAHVGDPSRPACVTPVDSYAPAPPTGLATVASEGAISLIWEPGAESDLGGYIVLRGDGPDATLQPLTPAPIADARYRDTSVQPGVHYMYAVIAVDNRVPVPNLSAPSATVEETAR